MLGKKAIALIIVLLLGVSIPNYVLVNPEMEPAQASGMNPIKGTLYYINTSGSDGNNGTWGHPWKTIGWAVNHTSSGDTINIMAGAYKPSSYVYIHDKSTIGQWYTIKNYNNDRVIINGSNCPKDNWIRAVFDFEDCNYIHISGLTFNHSGRGAITFRSATSHITIDNCSFTNNSQHAIKVISADNLTISHCYVYNNFNNWSAILKSDDGGIDQETFSLESCINFNVNNNTMRANRQLNIDVKGGCCKGKICYNRINTTSGLVLIQGTRTYGGSGIYLDSRGISKNVSMYNNAIYGNNSGIEISTETTGHYEYIYIYNNVINITNPGNKAAGDSGRSALGIGNLGLSTDVFHNIYIYSNLLSEGVNNDYAPFQVGHYSQVQLTQNNLKNVYVKNNIFYMDDTGAGDDVFVVYKINITDVGVFTFANNSYNRTNGAIRCVWGPGPTYTTYTSTANPEMFGSRPIFTSPKFKDRAHGNCHLNVTSPCIDKGNSTLVPSFDFDGFSRPMGKGYDIGPFEYLPNVTIYAFNPITSFRVCPTTSMPVNWVSNTVSVATCPNEYVAASFVINPSWNLTSLLPVPGTLACGTNTIPGNASNVDIKIVKCWYQKSDGNQTSNSVRLFIPELLLNDDNLVHTTYINQTRGYNYLRTSTGYVNISGPGQGPEYAQIYDNATLQPVYVNASTNKQFWITVHVPNGTVPGTYTGPISLMNNGGLIGQVQLSVTVLPFTLPNSPVEISLYYTQMLATNGSASLSPYARSQTQLHAEFKDMKKHSITNPVVDQSYYYRLSNFTTYMQIRKAEGMSFDRIYYGANVSGATTAITTAQTKTIVNFIANNYSTNGVYFYQEDEKNLLECKSRIQSIYATWNGSGNTMDAQSRTQATLALLHNPSLIQLFNLGGHPNPSLNSLAHTKNCLVGSYGNPQTDEERPVTLRRNFGLLLWQNNVDVSSTFAYAYGNSSTGYRLVWNDWNWNNDAFYKEHVFAYPTTTGVVDTVQYEGFREGANDIRYMKKLTDTILKASSQGRDFSAASAFVANLKNWNITDMNGIDPAQVRSQIIYFINQYYNNLTANVITPQNGTIVGKTPTCKLFANASHGGTLTINFYDNSTGSWIHRQKNTTVANSTVQWSYSQAMLWNKQYCWTVTIFDGMTNRSATYSFKTGPTIYIVSPKNSSGDVNRKPTCTVVTNDTAGKTLTVNWYNSTDGWTFYHRQKNASVSANSTVRWNYSQAANWKTNYYWKVTVDDGTINTSNAYYFTIKKSSVYGMIGDSILSTYAGDASPNAVGPNGIRINSSEFYLTVSSIGLLEQANVIRVCNYSGWMEQDVISNYTYDYNAGAGYPVVVHIGKTDKYAIAYHDGTDKKVIVKTIRVRDNNGTIAQSYIDTQNLSYYGWDVNILAVTDHVYVVAYFENTTHNGYLETIWIDNSGMINNTIVSTVQYSTNQGATPHMILLDYNTIALNYVCPGTDGKLQTYNVSYSGNITSIPSDSWEYETNVCFQTSIIRVSGNIYAISYDGKDYPSGASYIRTVNISQTGKITKSFISTFCFDSKDGNYSTMLKIQQGVFAIAYQGSGGTGWIKTVNISDTGVIGASVIDSLQFDTKKCASYPFIIYVNKSYYLIVYERYWYTGFGSTVEMETKYSPTTYYMSYSGGSDSNDGTSPNTPWKTIAYLDTKISDGTIKLGEDIYFKRGDVWNNGSELRIKTGGTSSNWMIIGAYGTGAKPHFNGTDSRNDCILLATKNTNYTRIENLYLSNITKGNTDAIFCYGKHDHITIQNVDITGIAHGGDGAGIFFNQTSYPCVRNCTMRDLGDGAITFYGSLINQINNGSMINCTAVHCAYLYNRDVYTIHTGDVNNEFVGSNFLVKNCTGSGGNEQAFDFCGAHNVLCINCTSFNDNDSAISSGNPTPYMAANLTYINYLSYNENGTNTAAGFLAGDVNHLILRNSVFYNEQYHFFVVEANSATNFYIFNNDFILGNQSRNSQMMDITKANGYHGLNGGMFKNNIILSLNGSFTNRFVRYLNASNEPVNVNPYSTNTSWSHNLWYRTSDTGSWQYNNTGHGWTTWNTSMPSRVTGEKNTNPKLYDPSHHNFNLTRYSPCIDAGANLTTTNGGGIGTTIVLADANYFMDGYGLYPGDKIFVGDDQNLRITEIVYSTNTITVNRNITWANNEPVGFQFNGKSPDIGAKESATGLYVATTGNDSNDGSFTHPWATLEYALFHANAGDTVYVMAGTYYDSCIYGYAAHSGTASKPITYKAYGNGEVILDGSAATWNGWAGVFYLYNVKYVRISGFTMRNGANFGFVVETSGVANTNNITIDNCSIHNITCSGICFRGSSYRISDLLVENCVVYDCINSHSHAYTQETITFDGCQRYTCRNNTIYGIPTNIGINSKNSCSKGYIYNNRINTTHIYGCYVDGGSTFCNNISFYNNIAWGRGAGFGLATEAGGTLRDITYYNNIFNGTGGSGFKIDYYSNATSLKTNIKYINNIVHGANYSMFFAEQDSRMVNMTIRNNIFDPLLKCIFNPGGVNLTKHHVDHNLYNGSSDFYGGSSINASPKFINSKTNFHSKAASAAIDAGSSVIAPTMDRDGNARPQGSGYDIGAYEYRTEASSFQISGFTKARMRNSGDTLNFSVTLTGATAVYINILTPKGTTINQSILQNHSITNTYWCNRTFSNGKNHLQYGYGWPDVTCGNGTYQVYIFAKSAAGAVKSTTTTFSICPNGDVTLDNITNFLDLSAIIATSNWGKTGTSHFIPSDTNGDGIVNINDLTYVTYGKNWGWRQTP